MAASVSKHKSLYIPYTFLFVLYHFNHHALPQSILGAVANGGAEHSVKDPSTPCIHPLTELLMFYSWGGLDKLLKQTWKIIYRPQVNSNSI